MTSTSEIAGAEGSARVSDLGIRLRVWLTLGDKVTLGPGRAELLQAVDRLGSIRQAAKQLGMSYRLAWGYLRNLEAAVGFPLIEPRRAASRVAGTRLTLAGRDFLARYLRLQRRMESAVAREFTDIFSRG